MNSPGTTKHPQVAGFLDDHLGTIRILCPYCGLFHIHGRSPGNRIPHCIDKKGLPEYTIILVGIPAPGEASAIDRKARRDRVFQNHTPAAAARELNGRILAEVAHAE